MMTLWCIMRSPLMIGAEMTKLDDFTLGLLTNRAVLDMETKTWCAHPLYTTEEKAAWIAPRKDGQGVYVALFNLSDERRTLSLGAEEAGLTGIANARELWTGSVSMALTAELAPHDAAVWLVREA